MSTTVGDGEWLARADANRQGSVRGLLHNGNLRCIEILEGQEAGHGPSRVVLHLAHLTVSVARQSKFGVVRPLGLDAIGDLISLARGRRLGPFSARACRG